MRHLEKHRAILGGSALLLSICLFGCENSGTDPDVQDIEARQVLEDVSTKVIYGTYSDLADKAAALEAAVAAFDADRTQTKLDAAKQAWRNARRPWEQSEGFLFGPVETEGIDPSIDRWPLNKVDLDGVLSGNATLTKEFIDNQVNTLKGFHTIEYLLFGANNSKTTAEFTTREGQYLIALAASFKGAVDQLKTAWSPTGGNYLAHFKAAGQGDNIYASQRAALQELVQGMIGICDEVANGKIGDPLSRQDRTLEESQFSDNSNADFQDNIRSAQNVYLGTYGGASGQGVSKVVAEKKPDVDMRLKQELEAAILAIGEMQPSFGVAIFSNKAKVEAAQAAVQKVMATLEQDVLPILTL